MGGGGGGDDGTEYQREQEEKRQQRIKDGMARIDKVFSQFNDKFYDQRKTAYIDFATPQLEKQLQDQTDNLAYALARTGNLNSSMGIGRWSDLNTDYGLQQQAMIDRGMDYANQAKADVATQKSNLVSLLQASADPDAAVNVAQAQAASLSSMPAFDPLEPVVQNAAQGIGSYLAGQQYAALVDAVNQKYSKGAGWSGSGKVGR